MAKVGLGPGIRYPRGRILTEGPTEVNAPSKIVSQDLPFSQSSAFSLLL